MILNLPRVLGMRGIAARLHVVGVELFVVGEVGDGLAVALRRWRLTLFRCGGRTG